LFGFRRRPAAVGSAQLAPEVQIQTGRTMPGLVEAREAEPPNGWVLRRARGWFLMLTKSYE
jgi:hypothetical protein